MARLTDAFVKSVKPNGAQQEFKDDGYKLRLVVQPKGAKSWQYRWKQHGLSRRHTFGHYPMMTLADARKAALLLNTDTTALAAVAADHTAAHEIAAEPVIDTRMTVAEAYALYIESDKVKKLSPATKVEKLRAFEKDISPSIGGKALLDITYEDIETVIDKKFEAILEADGNGVGANRLHANISGFLRWCRTHGRSRTGLKTNPMIDMPKPADENCGARHFNKSEIEYFFAALPAADNASCAELKNTQ